MVNPSTTTTINVSFPTTCRPTQYTLFHPALPRPSPPTTKPKAPSPNLPESCCKNNDFFFTFLTSLNLKSRLKVAMFVRPRIGFTLKASHTPTRPPKLSLLTLLWVILNQTKKGNSLRKKIICWRVSIGKQRRWNGRKFLYANDTYRKEGKKEF